MKLIRKTNNNEACYIQIEIKLKGQFDNNDQIIPIAFKTDQIYPTRKLADHVIKELIEALKDAFEED